ncbi:hypothetical protein KXV81_002468 [Aspergillus fumigatus]|nr:hypothetical protein CNMCM8714_003800 [Aspergillus fumigatus]KAH1268757.1 hypothetical protein KXX30_006935 [Aspergillus fumigatus]KAH1308384.1 hypothetical protein KXX47_007667 [Aspergillus fumigatus]KAH1334954.1 hypothetical protein KXX14_008763 [Aspergillus fumigatus]KAH1456817.1 hypothetical protein KXX58_000359 [Aspergillus fumigatus]
MDASFPVTTTAIDVWGVSLPSSASSSSTGGPVPIILTSSVQPPPFTVTVTPVISGTTSIIGATETTTLSLDPIIWGSSTYSPPVETRSLGGSTTVIGGTTLPPTPITVTPNPHPTTTPDPGSTDPALNSKKPSWTPGKPPTPTAEPGCPGCGTRCLLFCNPDCPFCPPGAFGPPGGGGGDNNNNDDDDDDDEDPDHEGAQYTIVFDSMNDDPFPTAFVGAADLSSVDAEVMSRVSSAWGLSTTTTTTTTTTKPTTTTTTEKPTPTPTADCMFWDSIFYYTFEIYNIDGWVSDGGDSLHDEEGGCGALTGWEWHEESSDHYAYVYFNLPFFMKAGCVERAIVSAGGPKISCQGGGVGPTKREVNVDVDFDIEDEDEDVWISLDARGNGKTLDTPVFPSWTNEQLQEFQTFYEAINMQSGTAEKTYVPMTWGGTSTSPMTTSA